ncbi:50S ribosomal protein L19e [Candidatus Altiarchaeota archaeon]
MNLTSQRNIAAKILKVGTNKVRFDPERAEEVSEALTREDIRYLIGSGAIKALQNKGISKGRGRKEKARKAKGRGKGHGKRSGTANARSNQKTLWIGKIRAIRDELKKMREEEVIDRALYRTLYRQATGNYFQSRRHLREHVERLGNK